MERKSKPILEYHFSKFPDETEIHQKTLNLCVKFYVFAKIVKFLLKLKDMKIQNDNLMPFKSCSFRRIGGRV